MSESRADAGGVRKAPRHEIAVEHVTAAPRALWELYERWHFGKQHSKRGMLTFTQYKGRNRKPHKQTLPILPALQDIIEASPCGDLTFLINDFGRPFTNAGFGNKFRDWCDQAIKPTCKSVQHMVCARQAQLSRQITARPPVN